MIKAEDLLSDGLTMRGYLVGKILTGAANYYGTDEEVAMIASRAVRIADAAIGEMNRVVGLEMAEAAAQAALAVSVEAPSGGSLAQ